MNKLEMSIGLNCLNAYINRGKIVSVIIILHIVDIAPT